MINLLQSAAIQARKNALLVVLAITLGVLSSVFFYQQPLGAAFPVFVVLTVASLFVALQAYGRKPIWSEYWIALPLVAFALLVAVRANGQVQAMNIFACIGLFLLLLSVAAGRSVREHGLLEQAKLAVNALCFFPKAFRTLGELVAQARHGHRKNMRQVVFGLLLAIPFLIVFGALFASADLAFGKSLAHLWPSFSFEAAWHRFWIAFISGAFLMGGFSAACHGRYLEAEESSARSGHDHHVAIATFLSLINALFIAFIIFQVGYLFGGASNIERLGFTYAEYARRGFFELLAVAALSFLMLLGLENALAGRGKKHASAFKLLSVLHVVLVGVVIVSAHQRLALYESTYGFTTLRFFVHAFIFLLPILFLILARKIVADGSDQALGYHLLLAAIVFCATVTLANPDKFVASQNLERYRQTGKIDAAYLGTLSPDALPVTISLLNAPDSEVRTAFEQALRTRLSRPELETGSWTSYHVSKARALLLLQAKAFDVDAMPENP